MTIPRPSMYRDPTMLLTKTTTVVIQLAITHINFLLTRSDSFIWGEMKTKYSIIIDGENFRCGSSREHASVCLDAEGAKALCKTGDVATHELGKVIVFLSITHHTTGKEYKLMSIGDVGPVIDVGGNYNK
ncbi:PREDICTED: 3-isopropylmalate dehydratase small subunit 3-like isoform X2 [Camelina sativa]|uniref:3-isopropylmalate dehydratase small subunit 3-like isoform X2 n=1 Tax=Camelina sativa TaxID=90675 RepID=A0ABM0W898_CAMSA|nr:PREDICTED: 3-isopropylmalate dehydratase small subunit 3-like isoform X2 [Camelina sativa]